MKSNTIVFSLIFAIISIKANCQIEIPKHTFVVGTGLGHNQLKDKLSSRLIFRGANFPLCIKYLNTSNNSQFRFGIAGNFSNPKSRFNDKALLVNYLVNLDFKYIIRNDEKWQIKLGGEVPFQTTIDFFEDIQAEYFYWLSSLSINPSISIKRNVDKGKGWFLETDFPLTGIFSRPPSQRFTNAEDNFGFILAETNTNYQLLFPFRHTQINIEGGFTYQLNNKVQQSFSYSLFYLRNNIPESISILRHQLNFSTYLNRK